jgi:hypothetical protein
MAMVLRRAPLGLALAVLAGGAEPARAQFFSPGTLARSHAPWSGDDLGNCARCHAENRGVSAERCLACHAPLFRTIARGEGLHGRMAAAKRDACQSCHPDHRGVDFNMVDWRPLGGRQAFNHALAGWPLAGKHAQLPRLVVDPESRRWLAAHAGARTFLGLSVACAACHADEHRGQVGRDCGQCHGDGDWKSTPRFDHRRTAYPLIGKHAAVACGKCHPEKQDAEPAGFPRPRSLTYLQLKPVEHQACTTCHKDPHKGSWGSGCVTCHSEAGWSAISRSYTEVPASFHDQAKFPLRGGHAKAPCRACHGPFPGRPAKFKGLAHEKCAACHADAHLGQLEAKGGSKRLRDCADCHGVDAFRPARFELEQHAALPFPLEGAHRAVACAACHAEDRRLATRIAPEARRKLKREKRPERWSLMVMRPDKAPRQCASCHQDVHQGQFAAAGQGNDCARCHEVESFRRVTFDHDRDSRYPLTGRHRLLACSACHQASGPGQAVRYRPLAAACATCHRDAHGGQFLFPQRGREPSRPMPENTRCEHCHQTKGWKDLLFQHDEPPFAAFALEGKHKTVACGGCHPRVEVAPGKLVTRYRPLPHACEACHADEHEGLFKGFAP